MATVSGNSWENAFQVMRANYALSDDSIGVFALNLRFVVAQCMETIIGKPIPNKFDLHFRSNISPAAAESLWAPIISVMLSLANQLENAFSRNRISNEAMSKAVPNFVGVVASIAELQKDNFSKFGSNVKVGG